MNKILLSLIPLFIIPLPELSQEDSSFAQCDTNFTVTVNQNGRKYDFCVKKEFNLIREIIYSVNSDDNIVLTPKKIKFTEDDFAHYIDFNDYNFDGYLDMYVHDPCMILGNCFGKVYIFKENLFTHDPQFDNLTTVSADPQNETIFSSNRSAAGTLFTNETFIWEGDSLILIKRVSQDYAPGHDSQIYLYKVEERDANGNLVTTEEKLIQEPLLE